jgi:hypothetical protein
MLSAQKDISSLAFYCRWEITRLKNKSFNRLVVVSADQLFIKIVVSHSVLPSPAFLIKQHFKLIKINLSADCYESPKPPLFQYTFFSKISIYKTEKNKKTGKKYYTKTKKSIR